MMSWIAEPEAWVALVTLTALEIVLGIDNIVFISILVGRLPEHQRQRARVIGLGIAMGSGTDVAIESAGIILVRSNPLDVVNIFELSRATYRKMIQNLIWATGYNVLAIPLAAGVLYNFGIVLSPEIGAVLMTISTVVVAINARLLKMPKMKIG